MKRAIVSLSEELIWQILDLPENVHLMGVRDNFLQLGIDVMIEGEGLQGIPDHMVGTEPWRLEARMVDGRIKLELA